MDKPMVGPGTPADRAAPWERYAHPKMIFLHGLLRRFAEDNGNPVDDRLLAHQWLHAIRGVNEAAFPMPPQHEGRAA